MMYEAKMLVEEANELMEFCKEMVSSRDMFNDMDGEVFDLYKKMFKLTDTSMKLVLEQARLMDEMDRKLDKLMEKLEAN